MWAEKYRPRHAKELVGQEIAFAILKNFVLNFSKHEKKAALLYGPSGIGKNSLVRVLAKEIDYEVIEFNASRLRDAMKIKELLKPASLQQTLFGRGSIIFVDEAEAFTRLDRGGLAAVISLLEQTRWPVIFTANDLWKKELNELRKKVLQIEVKKLNYSDITKILKRVCEAEGLQIKKEFLEKIAIKAKGDARAAINDLQSLASLSVSELPEPAKNELDFEKLISSLGEREKEESIFNALALIFKSKEARQSLDAFEHVNMPLDECLLWLDENLPLEYQGEELVKAYDALSKADIFRRRIIRQQYWRFLIYINALATAGITAAKSEVKKNYVSYKKLSRLLKIWMAKQKNLMRKEIAKKLAREMHCSLKKAYKEMPFFEIFFRNSSREEIASFAKHLRLSEEDASYLYGLTKLRKI